MTAQQSRLAASLLVTVASAVLVIFALSAADLHLDGYGLWNSLPVSFYIGTLGLVAAGLLGAGAGRHATALVALQIYGLVLALWIAPVALEHTARFRTAYMTYGYVDPILRGDGLLPTLLVYHNWPLFPGLFAGIVELTRITPGKLLAGFPVVIVLSYLLPIATLTRLAADPRPDALSWRSVPVLGRDPRWLLGLWVFVAFDWTGQDYFSPQALAFLIHLGWLAVLANAAVRKQGQVDNRNAGFIVALFTVVVATHVLTALIELAMLGALVLFRQIRRPAILVLCTAVFLAWQAFAAAPFYDFYGNRLLKSVLAAGDFLQINVAGRLSGTAEHLLVGRIRVGVSALAFGLALFAAVVLWRRDRGNRAGRFAIVALLGLAVITPVSVYGGEMVIRTLLFALPCIAMLVVSVARQRTVLVAAILAATVATGLHVLTHYGNEAYDYLSPGELAGAQYIDAHLSDANVYGGYPAAATGHVTRIDWRNSLVPSAKKLPSLRDFQRPDLHRWRHGSWTTYVALGRGDVAAASLFGNRPRLMQDVRQALDSDRHFRLVFANADFRLYRYDGHQP